jgi:hypothetical protein
LLLLLLAGVVAFLCVAVAGAELSGGVEGAVCAAIGDTAIEAAKAAANSRVERGVEFEKFTALIL